MASMWNHTSSVAALLAHPNIDVNRATRAENRTPLYIAAMQKHLEIVSLLTAHPGIDVNQATIPDNKTPLWVAIGMGHVGTVSHLTAHPDIDLDCRGDCKRTVIHEAVRVNGCAILILIMNRLFDSLLCEQSQLITPPIS